MYALSVKFYNIAKVYEMRYVRCCHVCKTLPLLVSKVFKGLSGGWATKAGGGWGVVK